MNITEYFPDISFIENTTVDEVLTDMINDYREKYREITGKEAYLAKANPYRLIMYACSIQIYQAMQYTDYAGKMNLLKYTHSDFMDNVGAFRGVRRKEATAASTTLLFSIEAPIAAAVPIPAGCRVTNGNDVYFATDEYAEIKAGETSVSVTATCTETGPCGNDFAVGEINIIVNTLPYIVNVTNTDKTYGGADIEDDESLANRIYGVPNSYSVAGPVGAYEYFTKSVDSSISDVVVKSPAPATIDIRFICEGGKLPENALIQKVKDYLENKNVRPLIDKVTVHAPDTKEYDIQLIYYIPSSKKAMVEAIQESVDTAVEAYNIWQMEKIGRDINPSYLIQKLMEAGVKRVNVSNPVFTILDDTVIAQKGSVTVTYGGIEDD